MAELKGLKKTIVYSNENEKNFMEGALTLISYQEKKSFSATLEDIVKEALLPDNDNAAFICKQIYSGYATTLEALENIYSVYAAGTNFHARWNNGLELVKFFKKIIRKMTFTVNKKNEGLRSFFCSNFLQTINYMKQLLNDEHSTTQHVYESQIELALNVLETAKNEPEDFNSEYLLDIIIFNWEILGNNTYTFRTLCSLCRLLKLSETDTQDDKLELISLIKKMSLSWD